MYSSPPRTPLRKHFAICRFVGIEHPLFATSENIFRAMSFRKWWSIYFKSSYLGYRGIKSHSSTSKPLHTMEWAKFVIFTRASTAVNAKIATKLWAETKKRIRSCTSSLHLSCTAASRCELTHSHSRDRQTFPNKATFQVSEFWKKWDSQRMNECGRLVAKQFFVLRERITYMAMRWSKH